MKKIALTAALAALLAGCSSKAVKPAKLKDFNPTQSVEVVWKNDLPTHVAQKGLSLNVAVSDFYIAYNDVGGVMALLDRHSGRRYWTISYPVRFGTTPWLYEKKLFTATQDGEAVAIDLDSAAPLWSTPLNTAVHASPVGDGKTVVYRGHDGSLTALDMITGERKWHYRSQMPSLSLQLDPTPVIYEDKVIAGFDNGHVVAFEINTGALMWDRPVATQMQDDVVSNIVDVSGQLVLDNDVLFVTTFNGNAMALNAGSGEVVWRQTVGKAVGLSYAHYLVFITDTNSHITAYDKKTGHMVWMQNVLDHRNIGRPVVMGQFVGVTDAEGYVHWFSAVNGHYVARHYVRGGSFLSEPTVYGKEMYVMGRTGHLEALALKK